jgi:16S rRNA (cytosine967-C5)-methyltransferase
MNVRHQACLIIKRVLSQQCSLNVAIQAELDEKQEFDPLVLELCYGTLRYFHQLTFLSQKLLETPLKGKHEDVHALILIGLYQLLHTRIPAHAAIDETVEATRKLRKPWASKLLNGVLRHFQRQQTILMTLCEQQSLPAFYSHPKWLIESIQQGYPEQWQNILNMNNQKPALSLRVNLSRTSRQAYLEKLAAEDLEAMPSDLSESGIILKDSCKVTELPGFRQGEFSVQDCSAQLAADLLDVQEGHHVLDACCAPGGKTTHLLEKQPNITLIALDQDRERLKLVHENAMRLLKGEVRKNALTILAGDASQPETWWDQHLFDRILLDAPCSATGIIRRHPDIKLLRKKIDIENLAVTQLQLLQALWSLLKSGGKLLYVTCSILSAENVSMITTFLESEKTAAEIPISASWGIAMQYGRQILPEEDRDGFYYCLLGKP